MPKPVLLPTVFGGCRRFPPDGVGKGADSSPKGTGAVSAAFAYHWGANGSRLETFPDPEQLRERTRGPTSPSSGCNSVLFRVTVGLP